MEQEKKEGIKLKDEKLLLMLTDILMKKQLISASEKIKLKDKILKGELST